MPAMVIAEESLAVTESPARATPTTTEPRSKKRKHGDEKGLAWYLKAPLRALRRMRDSYEKSMTKCAATRGTGYLRGSAGGAAAMMPRNISVRNHAAWANASEEDLRELMRVSSQGLLRAANPGVPRSQSAAPAVGRIDEDKEMDFDDGVDGGGAQVGGLGQNYPRSKSCAVALPSRNRTVPTSPARKV